MRILPLAGRFVLPVAQAMRPLDHAEITACEWNFCPRQFSAGLVAQESVQGIVAARDDGLPVAVIAACEMWPHVFSVGMFATSHWPEIARPLTRWARTDFRNRLLSLGGHRAECRSLAGHDVAHRWLSHLGFVEEAVMPDFGSNRETFHLFAWRLNDVHVSAFRQS